MYKQNKFIKKRYNKNNNYNKKNVKKIDIPVIRLEPFKQLQLLAKSINVRMFPFQNLAQIITLTDKEIIRSPLNKHTRNFIVFIRDLYHAEKIADIDQDLMEYIVGEFLPPLQEVFTSKIIDCKELNISKEGAGTLLIIQHLFKNFKKEQYRQCVQAKLESFKEFENCLGENSDMKFFDDYSIYKTYKWLEKKTIEKLIIICFNKKGELKAHLTYTNNSKNSTQLQQHVLESIYSLYPMVIFVHNHPRGESIPSEADINFTKRVSSVAKKMGANVLDHIIIGKDNYFSFYYSSFNE
ncbi:MAG: JAB domain-containing protein [Candidatus Woesearchaeota archaeon]